MLCDRCNRPLLPNQRPALTSDGVSIVHKKCPEANQVGQKLAQKDKGE